MPSVRDSTPAHASQSESADVSGYAAARRGAKAGTAARCAVSIGRGRQRSSQSANSFFGEQLLKTGLPEPGQVELVGAMGRIEALLGDAAHPWLLREPRPGDIGWVVARHGALYATEFGFDARFEALVAKVAGAFLEANDPRYERCWIAERDGVNGGAIFLERVDAETAKLRLLLVEPTARGSGIGRRLLAECVAFARAAGYRRIVLWTNDILTAARHLYVQAGFRLVATHPHSDFGPAMVGEDWELALRPTA
jgi:GNAT superfamily N-acetyltransferase